MSVATIGLYGSKPAFWPMPSTFLTGTAAAGGIALVNSIGNLGGYVGPFIVGWIKDATGSFDAGLVVEAVAGVRGLGEADHRLWAESRLTTRPAPPPMRGIASANSTGLPLLAPGGSTTHRCDRALLGRGYSADTRLLPKRVLSYSSSFSVFGAISYCP